MDIIGCDNTFHSREFGLVTVVKTNNIKKNSDSYTNNKIVKIKTTTLEI